MQKIKFMTTPPDQPVEAKVEDLDIWLIGKALHSAIESGVIHVGEVGPFPYTCMKIYQYSQDNPPARMTAQDYFNESVLGGSHAEAQS